MLLPESYCNFRGNVMSKLLSSLNEPPLCLRGVLVEGAVTEKCVSHMHTGQYTCVCACVCACVCVHVCVCAHCVSVCVLHMCLCGVTCMRVHVYLRMCGVYVYMCVYTRGCVLSLTCNSFTNSRYSCRSNSLKGGDGGGVIYICFTQFQFLFVNILLCLDSSAGSITLIGPAMVIAADFDRCLTGWSFLAVSELENIRISFFTEKDSLKNCFSFFLPLKSSSISLIRRSCCFIVSWRVSVLWYDS